MECQDWADGEHKNRFSKLTIVDKFGYKYLCTATALYCIVEYRFDDCRGKRNPLPFDFAIFDDNFVDLKWLCEFDGELHYQESRFSSDEKKNKKKLAERKRYDAIKTKYCKDNNIPLLRIPYWERDNGNVENVIDEFLEELHMQLSKSA